MNLYTITLYPLSGPCRVTFEEAPAENEAAAIEWGHQMAIKMELDSPRLGVEWTAKVPE